MKLLITSVLLFLAVSPLVQAKHNRTYRNNVEHSRSAFKAKVINSTPIYKYVTVRQPQTYCEPEVIRRDYRQSDDKGAAIVGGIVGGVIGHTTSNNRNKGLGTIVGAVIGSSLAHNIERAHNNDSGRYQVQQQNCVASYEKSSKVRVLDGYNVTYRSKGKLYRTFMADKPNQYIELYY